MIICISRIMHISCSCMRNTIMINMCMICISIVDPN